MDLVAAVGDSLELALADSANGQRVSAPWAGPLVSLGERVRRYADGLKGLQLVVAISVPRRDLAAGLVGCGWVVASPAPQLRTPIESFRALSPNTPVRMVTVNAVIADHFVGLERESTIVRLSTWPWLLSGVKAVGALSELDVPVRTDRPGAGQVAQWAGMDETWDEQLASPQAHLAIVGTLKWLQDEFRVFMFSEGEYPSQKAGADEESHRIAGLLLPRDMRAATWFTRIYASSRLAEELPLPQEFRAVILDGAGAIKYLSEIETAVAICILDRSVADETAAEILIQLRNTRGEPLSLEDDLGWRPPAGVEGLAFTMAL